MAQSPTHYEVLALSSGLLSSQNDPSIILKKAYHRALLRNHPDKTTSSILTNSNKDTTKSREYSVDQITEAFAVLSSPTRRAGYDNALRLSRKDGGTEGWEGGKFQTGIENVDLDDLAHDEAQNCWYRSCRCGNERGFLFREEDLEEVSSDGELMVGCLDCSLWLRVYFAVLEDEDDTAQEQ